MKVNFAGLAAALGMAAIAAFNIPVRAEQAPARSVLDGVYTVEQAKRGEALYGPNCASCHGNELGGQDESPALTGSAFTSNWAGTTAGELADRIRVSMPANDPGKLNRQEASDILAYILSFNKYPTGDKELPKEAEILSQIKIVAPKQG
jgi:mono/diheme cytochrome c family protein